MSCGHPTTRQCWRRTDDYTPGTPKLKLVVEEMPATLLPYQVLIKVHAVALDYRDANISNGGNPWPVTPNGIICNDAAGEVVEAGEAVRRFKVGDRVAPNTDSENITGRETQRSWLAADEDGVLADYLVFDEWKVAKLPSHLGWTEACIIPCAGVTAWSALKGLEAGQTALIQGTGGVAMFATKIAQASGYRVILTSSSDEKLAAIQTQFTAARILTVNYRNATWHEEVLRLTDGVGVDLVLENGGTGSLVQSVQCTRRGGIVSQVGYLGKQNPEDLKELLPTLIDRRVNLRGINAGSVQDFEDLVTAISAMKMRFFDIVDTVFPFSQSEEALEYLWQGKQVGKIVLEL
ncbi:alcohol dehydrogenase [Cordyceps militaris]|uniref:Alcohol dehydrogenase n=1 Tax=Cordyceps militaris TaxID=73501 RepID=A0A2H4SMM2_CORMI|nr:alcohol dehydrogenase [Cordyceps militaris]